VTSAVLIADGNAGRARRLAKACGTRGFRTALAATGAAALEAALQEVPDIVVAPSDLPLIDAQKLAEILGANPRTEAVRFLFLAREELLGRVRGAFDETLPPSADADEVASCVESMLAQRARMDAVDRNASSDHEVEGKLSQIPLTDLLQLFHMNRRTGTLELTRRVPGGQQEHGSVLIREGNLVQANAGVGVEGEKALFRLLAWRDGRFAFSPNRVTATPRILRPTRALLMEGMRQLDEWDRMRGSLPPLGAGVALAVSKEELPNAVHPVTQEVLLLLEIYEGVQDVVDHCSYPDYQVLRTLQTLVQRGMVSLRRDPGRPDPAGRDSLFEPAQVRRFRDWLEASRPRGGEPPDAKLLVVSSDPAATRDFARLLTALPGMHLQPRFQRGEFHENDVEPLGRLAVGDGLGIRLLHVPADPVFAPAWPVLAHGSLGTLFLQTGTDSDSQAQLQEAVAGLGAVPHARLFHLLLLRKGERVAPEELQEQVSLLESASLFLVPLESGKDPAVVLRTMLARVMP